jgi:hypothetical protein
MTTFRARWSTIRRIWATTGACGFEGFTLWNLMAYRATSEARLALLGDATVRVTRGRRAIVEALAPASWRHRAE